MLRRRGWIVSCRDVGWQGYISHPPPVRALDVLVRTTCSVEMVRLPYNYVRTTPLATLCRWLRGVREFWIDSVYLFDDDVVGGSVGLDSSLF